MTPEELNRIMGALGDEALNTEFPKDRRRVRSFPVRAVTALAAMLLFCILSVTVAGAAGIQLIPAAIDREGDRLEISYSASHGHDPTGTVPPESELPEVSSTISGYDSEKVYYSSDEEVREFLRDRLLLPSGPDAPEFISGFSYGLDENADIVMEYLHACGETIRVSVSLTKAAAGDIHYVYNSWIYGVESEREEEICGIVCRIIESKTRSYVLIPLEDSITRLDTKGDISILEEFAAEMLAGKGE